jgi:hypothetical protein
LQDPNEEAAAVEVGDVPAELAQVVILREATLPVVVAQAEDVRAVVAVEVEAGRMVVIVADQAAHVSIRKAA